MTPDDVKAVGDLIDLLRKKGAKRFAGYGVDLELGPLDAPAKGDAKREHADHDACKCGHELTEHQAGLCLRGCDIDKCVGEVTT